jgi:hypothetical protein
MERNIKLKGYDKPKLKHYGDLKKATNSHGGRGSADVNYSQVGPI